MRKTQLRLWCSAIALTFASASASCFAPTSNSQRLLEAARELNLSTRFGRMDVAMASVTPSVRSAFMKRRALWGGNLRVLDVDLAGLEVDDRTKTAKVEVDVAWVRMNEGTLRTTRITQDWALRDNGWRLSRESRLSGDTGLFGEPAADAGTTPPINRSAGNNPTADNPSDGNRSESTSAVDTHFATRRLSPVVEAAE